MKTNARVLAAAFMCAMLSACASSGTRVSGGSETYREMAKAQQSWCSMFGFGCACYLDDVQTSCSLVSACLNSRNCQRASQ